MSEPSEDFAPEPGALPPHKVARVVLAFFLGTFLASRMMVLLIMSRRTPDFFLHVGQTHVHHLNYGIFLLAGVGAAVIFRPAYANTSLARALYGVALGLTFDEFGMWLHLGGSYWQRASYDAVIVISLLLGLITVAPRLRRWRARHLVVAALLLVALGVVAALMADSWHRARDRWSRKLELIEQYGPP